MIKTMKPWIAGLCAGALAALAGPALADYPEKPVTMMTTSHKVRGSHAS